MIPLCLKKVPPGLRIHMSVPWPLLSFYYLLVWIRCIGEVNCQAVTIFTLSVGLRFTCGEKWKKHVTSTPIPGIGGEYWLPVCPILTACKVGTSN